MAKLYFMILSDNEILHPDNSIKTFHSAVRSHMEGLSSDIFSYMYMILQKFNICGANVAEDLLHKILEEMFF